MAQAGNIPMSRTLHDRLLPQLHRFGNEAHTSIRPFHYRDIAGIDTLDASLSCLSSWAQRSDTVLPGTSEIRIGPLLDAQVGFDLGKEEVLTYNAGAGFWAEADLGPHWSVHLNGQFWATDLPAFLDTFALATGNIPGRGIANGDDGSYTHHDFGGYVNYSPNKFFDISIGRGKNFFGEGYRSLFLSDNAYSYPFLKITTKVWKIRYVNLFSQLSDIRNANGSSSAFAKKYSSMHYLSWNVSKRVNFSIFEGIVWQSNDNDFQRGFDINYLNPVILYRPVEFGLGSPDNALLGFGFNIKMAKRNLIYGQLLFDEFLLQEIRAGDGWFGNKQAAQLGLLFHDIAGHQGLDLRSELNYVRPFMYTHSDTRQNYAHHGQALAHPYGSNFWEWINVGSYRRDRLTITNTLSVAEMGVDTGQFSFGNDIFRPENDRPRASTGLKNRGFFLLLPSKQTVIQNELKASYLIAPSSGMSLQFSYVMRDISREHGEDETHHWFNVGIISYFREQDVLAIPRYVLP